MRTAVVDQAEDEDDSAIYPVNLPKPTLSPPSSCLRTLTSSGVTTKPTDAGAAGVCVYMTVNAACMKKCHDDGFDTEDCERCV